MNRFDHSKRLVIHNPGSLDLFAFEQARSGTYLSIHSRQTHFTRQVNYKSYKGSTISRHVDFILCDQDFSDSFIALSIAHSLVKVFEQRQFGKGDKRMVMECPMPEDYGMRLFCRMITYGKKHEGLELGWKTTDDGKESSQSHTLHIGQVHHLRNALHRAMGWIAPDNHVQLAELQDYNES